VTKLYDLDRDAYSLEPHYSRHVMAMTAEELHAKSDIAAELAFRDKRIAALEAERDALRVECDGWARERDEAVAERDAARRGRSKP
jgi:hypothetical protein